MNVDEEVRDLDEDTRKYRIRQVGDPQGVLDGDGEGGDGE